MPRTTFSKASSSRRIKRGCTKSSTMASPAVGSKKRSILRNFLSQPARSASNDGELHASLLTQTCARCNGFARNRRAVTSYRARAITCCQEAGNKADFHGADGKRAFRQKMDGRAADRQLQGPDRQARDQAAAGHLLSCLAAAKTCANTGIKHEAAAAAPAAALEPRATVKLQLDVDIDLGQQRNLDSATQAAERECRHGRSQLGMRSDVTAALVEAHRDVEPSVAPWRPPREGRNFSRVARGASVKHHATAGQEAGLACATGLGADRQGLAGYPLTDRRQFDILQCGPRLGVG